MPCGMPIDELIARMKASGVPGSFEADRVLDLLLSADNKEPITAEELKTSTRETGSDRIGT